MAERANVEQPYRIDLHVHTGRYSQCAELVDPYRIEHHALRAGLDAVVLTEHDMLWEEEELSVLQESASQIRFFRGIEVTARDCHLIVIGIDDAGALFRGVSAEEVIETTHTNDGCVILAHPFRDADPSRIPVQRVDAIEVGSTSFSETEALRALELCRQFEKPAVASSDGHALSRIGWAWTEFPREPENEHSLADQIRSGLGTAIIPNTLPGGYGDP